MKPIKIGAIAWIACLQYFVAEAIAIAAWPGAYSLSRNYISDLGAVGCGVVARGLTEATQPLCSPLHGAMNASFLLQGVLILGGAALLRPALPRGALGATARLLIGAAGAGVFLVGLAPEDVLPKLHVFGTIENFLCCNAGMAIMGAAMLRVRPSLPGLVTLGAGIVGLVALGLLASRADLGLGVGGIERVVAYPFPLWLAGMGAMLLRRSEAA